MDANAAVGGEVVMFSKRKFWLSLWRASQHALILQFLRVSMFLYNR